MKWETIKLTLTTRSLLGKTKGKVLAEIRSLWKMFHFIELLFAIVLCLTKS
jgi:hypothetical protein